VDCSRVLSWVQASKLTGALNEEQLFASIALFVFRLTLIIRDRHVLMFIQNT